MSQYLKGALTDRWIGHKRELLDLQYIQPGEELRVFRLSVVEEMQ